MKLLTKKLAAQLQRNARQRAAASAQCIPEPDPLPVVRFFNPLGSAS